MKSQLVIGVSAMFLGLGAPLGAAAQEIRTNTRDTVGSSVTLADIHRSPALALSRWTDPSASSEAAIDARWQTSQLAARQGGQTTAASGKRSPMRIILGAAVGATAGLFAGGYIGAWIEGDRCECDDPGLMGALIGAPIGAAAGGILGGFFLF